MKSVTDPSTEILGIVGLVLGGSALCFGLWQCWRELSPRRWRKVSGRVVAITIVREDFGRGVYQFVPVVEYDYEYGDHAYRSSCRRAGNFGYVQKETAEAAVSRYRVGGDVDVFVNPKHPAKSMIEPGATLAGWICTGLGLVFMVFSVFSLKSR